MRDVGYTLETALADIIDNSITARSTHVEIFASTSGPNPRLAVLDDGAGMSADQLVDAMRLGNRGPLAERQDGDLGRFGLGLKTASFSQCRRLTVVSRKAKEISAARWDLDLVNTTNEWLLEIPDDPAAIPFADRLVGQGTLVLWENLDRLVGTSPDGSDAANMVRRMNDAATHLELVFHRYLAGEKGLGRLAISLNQRPLVAFDPFHSSHAATGVGPVETLRIGGHPLTVQAFTLPHHKKVSLSEWERRGGVEGYVKNQGFYLYRAKRLIIHGTWFGLARQAELTKLARVRIDMPNDMDSDWNVDIKKASAQPPALVRKRLKQLIEEIGAGSRRVYTARGHRLAASNPLSVWRRIQEKNEIRYRINDSHPVLASFSRELTEDLRREFYQVVELVGASLPIDGLFADISGQPTQIEASAISDDSLLHTVEIAVRELRQAGLTAVAVQDILRTAEPFRSNWERTQAYIRGVESSIRADQNASGIGEQVLNVVEEKETPDV